MINNISEIETDTILMELKRRYRSEMAILDYIEMIECEILALGRDNK